MPACCGMKLFSHEEPRHIMICGPASSGKTFLLYKLRIPHLENAQLARTLIDLKKNTLAQDPDRPSDTSLFLNSKINISKFC